MKHARIYILRMVMMLILSTLLLQSCSKEDDPAPSPGPDNPPEPELTTPRTVLVYMVATNNLGSSGFDKSDINEMLRGAQNGDLGEGRMIVYHASDKGLVLKEITPEGIDTLKVYDKSVSSVSIERMCEVVKDTKELAPARDYGLVLWSHATGWLQDGIEEATINVHRSYGADGSYNAKKMNISSLASALGEHNFSFIYFDCCYMGSIELVYEMRKCADYLIVSPAEDPADGMPYDLNMPHFFSKDKSVEEIAIASAKTTFDYYNDKFLVGDCPCTMTVVDTRYMEELANSTKALYVKATTSVNDSFSYQKYKVTGQCYYYDFDEYIESISNDNKLLAALRESFDKAVIYSEATLFIWYTPLNRCCGLSTYILQNESYSKEKNYNTLQWYDDVASYLFK